MMMEWTTAHWVAYSAVQYGTMFAYLLIPVSLYYVAKNHGIEAFIGNEDSPTVKVRVHPTLVSDNILYRCFILACAAHHATHPIFMMQGNFWGMMLVDSNMVTISSLTAYRGIRIFQHEIQKDLSSIRETFEEFVSKVAHKWKS